MESIYHRGIEIGEIKVIPLKEEEASILYREHVKAKIMLSLDNEILFKDISQCKYKEEWLNVGLLGLKLSEPIEATFKYYFDLALINNEYPNYNYLDESNIAPPDWGQSLGIPYGTPAKLYSDKVYEFRSKQYYNNWKDSFKSICERFKQYPIILTLWK